jgi:hypothetical protein
MEKRSDFDWDENKDKAKSELLAPVIGGKGK